MTTTTYRGPIRAVWQLFGPYRRRLAVGVALRFAQALVGAAPVVALVWTIERVRTQTLTAPVVTTAIVVMVAAAVVQYGLAIAANRFAWISTYEAIGDARLRALEHVHRVPLGTLRQRGTGDVSSVLTTDYEAVSTFASVGMQQLLGAAALPVFVFAGLLVLDPAMAAATTASVLVAAPLFWWANRYFRANALDRGDRMAASAGRIVEYVQGIAVIRAFDRTGERLGWYRDAVADLRAVNDRLAVRLTPIALLTMGTVQLGVPLVVAAGAYRLFGGGLDAAALIAFLVLILRVYNPLLELASSVEQVRLADAALERICRLLALPAQTYPDAPVAKPSEPSVQLDGVTFGYQPDQPVLHDVSFAVPPRTVTAIVGPSGAGKTTLLNLVARFWDPDSGAITVGGTDLRHLSADQLFDTITLVPQDVYLFQGTVRDNIALGNTDLTPAAVEAAARTSQAHDFITDLPHGYGTPIGEGGQTLSGGERQRVSIARAVAKGAPILLLDEATAALDPINEHAVQQALARLVQHRTVLVVAHRLNTIRDADQIIVLESGKVAETGTHDELLAAGGLYTRMWHERTKASQWQLNPTPPTGGLT
ncbi:ABC transporter ATP-binding protein [Phytohabitans sp. LJ34]|uniref:ABC transporter ATP-binding protein n=1 Tax=Phytohabitans sp. LJ34 TaxID=3452217 RepID=UPI003F8C578A